MIFERLLGWMAAAVAVGCGGAADASPGAFRPLPDGGAALKVAAGEVRITPLRIGTVTVKTCHRSLCVPAETPVAARFGQIFASTEWSTPMPIYAYLIRHPEGVFLVDTGELERFNTDPDYYRCDRAGGEIDRGLLRVAVARGNEADRQLARLGVARNEVRGVILTHLHADHTGGVPYFPGVPVYTSRVDFELGSDGGAVTCRSLADAKLRFMESLTTAVDGEDEGTLGPTHALTEDGAIRIVSTPGHTPGALSVLVRGVATDVLFTGDVSFTDEMLRQRELAGIHLDLAQADATYQRLLRHAARRPTVILPAHDPAAPARLREGRTLDRSPG